MIVRRISREGYRPSRIASDLNSTAKEIARTPRKQKTSTTTKTQIEGKRLFWEVILAYRERSQSQANQTPDALWSRKRRATADFVKDVESATRFALQGKGLFPEWQRLAKDDVWQVPSVMRQIIGRCARVYRERGLQPDRYFTPDKSGSAATAPRSVFRTPTRALCKEHGLQGVTHRLPKPDGNILRLKCGCDRSEGIAAAVPAVEAAARGIAMPQTASASSNDTAFTYDLIGAVA